jgi:hypothetical protein
MSDRHAAAIPVDVPVSDEPTEARLHELDALAARAYLQRRTCLMRRTPAIAVALVESEFARLQALAERAPEHGAVDAASAGRSAVNGNESNTTRDARVETHAGTICRH